MLPALAAFGRAARTLPKGPLVQLVSTSSEALNAQASAAKKATPANAGKPPLYKEFQIYRCLQSAPAAH